MKCKELYSLIVVVLFCSIPAQVQERPPAEGYTIRKAQEFLRSLYPGLNGKGYVMSLESSQLYDVLSDRVSGFKLFVGAQHKGFIRGYVGGYTGRTPPPNYQPGPIYATQYLNSDFSFDEQDRFIAFSAFGPAVGDPDRLGKIGQILQNHRNMTANQVTGTLIEAGAKFGSWNQDKFLENVRAKNLERFLGKISITSAEFPVPDKENTLPSEWPMWTVLAKVSWGDGAEITYEMEFEPFKGDLVKLRILPHPPNAKQ